MTGRGFIHDKLEIKFLILYIAARVIEPVPFDTLLDLTLCDDAIDYFDFSECLADLVKTGHLTLDELSGLYAITDKGRRTSEICETSLPYSVRLRCDKKPEESGACTGWLFRRLCGFGCSGGMFYCPWFRYRRFHPAARFLLRCGRNEADLRNSIPVWTDCLWLFSGSDWTAGKKCGGLRGNAGAAGSP